MSNLFVLVADSRNAKLLERKKGGRLDEHWQLFWDANDKVRALNQSPDTREVTVERGTADATRVADETFVAEIAARLAETCIATEVEAVLLVAPQSFADMLQRGLSDPLWKRVQHVVPRDKTDLDDSPLRTLVEQTVAAYA